MNATPGLDFDQASVAQRMRDIREATRVVTEGFSREYMRECIDNHRFPQEAWEALGEYGLLGITIPEELGGTGGGQVELVALMEALAEAGLVLPMLLLTGFARVPIIRHGALSRQIEWVREMANQSTLRHSFPAILQLTVFERLCSPCGGLDGARG